MGVGNAVCYKNISVLLRLFYLLKIAHCRRKNRRINMSTENTNNEETQLTQADNGATKTFTQDDVNRIVQDRLAKDRAKTSEELDKRTKELNDREFRLNSRQKLIDRGLPEDMLDVLNCSSEDAFDKALDRLEALIKERTPEPKLQAERAQFTMPPINNNKGGTKTGDALIREAMNM